MSKHSIRIGIWDIPSACWRPSSASIRWLRRRSERRRSWSSASRALRSASSKIRRLSPRSAERTVDRGAAAFAERLGEGLGALGAARDDHLRRDRHRAGVVLEHELLEHLGLVAPGGVLEVERLPVGEHALAHLEHLRVGVGLLGCHRHGVERADRVVGHPLALQQRAHGPQLVAELRGGLELLVGGGQLHRLVELALDLAVAAGEEGDDRLDVLPVLLLAHRIDAWGLAALDVVLQARAARQPARLPALAGAVLEHLAEQVERAPHALGVGERAEVDAAALVALAGEVDPRVLLVQADRDVRVALVVAQPHVEARAGGA